MSTSPWAALLPAALAGTRRHPFAPLPGLTPSLGAEAAAPEKELLLTVANAALVQRAGRRPLPGPAASLGRAAAETRPPLPPASGQVLRTVLLDTELERIEGWCLRLVAARGYRLAPRDLAALLRVQPNRPNWHYRLDRRDDRLAGQRGEWLHGLQEPEPDAPPATPPPPSPPVADWPGYTWAQLRAQRPPGGWEWLLSQATARQARGKSFWWDVLFTLHEWQQREPVPASFASLLDELLPDNIYNDRIAEALAVMPGNALVERHWQRARPLLTYQPGADQLQVTLPVWHESWAPDQIKERTYDSFRSPGQNHLLALLGWIPPAHWLAAWQLTAPQAIALAAANEHGHVVLAGWLAAAHRHGDLAFLRAALTHIARQPQQFIKAYQYGSPVNSYFTALPEPEQAAWLPELLPSLPLTDSENEAGNVSIRCHWVVEFAREAPPVLVQLVQPFLRRWLELPPASFSYYIEPDLAWMLANYLAKNADLALLPWLEAELLPLARAQPKRQLAQAVFEAHRRLTLRQQLVASLEAVAG